MGRVENRRHRPSQHLPGDLANVNLPKPCLIPVLKTCCSQLILQFLQILSTKDAHFVFSRKILVCQDPFSAKRLLPYQQGKCGQLFYRKNTVASQFYHMYPTQKCYYLGQVQRLKIHHNLFITWVIEEKILLHHGRWTPKGVIFNNAKYTGIINTAKFCC